MQKRFTPDEGGVFPEWEEKTLGECMTLIASKGYKGKDLVNDESKAIMFSPSDIDTFGAVSLVKNTHISDELFQKSKEALVKNGDILFTKTASIGKVGYVKNLDHNATINPQIVILRANENVDSYFLFCAVRTETFKKQVRKISGGTTIKTMSQEALKKLKIKIPKSIEEQRKIAAALAAYDEMIAVKTAKLEVWQECKKRMVKEIFGRTRRFVDDDGKEFPEWEEKTLGEISEPLKYGMSAAAVKYDGENKYLRITDIDEASRKYVSDKIASPEASKIAEKFLVQKNDLLFARTGASVGKTYLYDETDGKMYYAGYLIKAHIKPEYDSQFIFQLTLTNEFKKWVKKESMRTAQPGINAECLAKYKMMIPCMEEQQKIGSFLAEIDKEIEIQKEFIKTYAEGKKRMMMELMEG